MQPARTARLALLPALPLAFSLAPGPTLRARDAGSSGTRLLRSPTVSATQVAFEDGADIWVVGPEGGDARRLTATPAVETEPHVSPDGKWIAFTSNRTGSPPFPDKARRAGQGGGGG